MLMPYSVNVRCQSSFSMRASNAPLIQSSKTPSERPGSSSRAWASAHEALFNGLASLASALMPWRGVLGSCAIPTRRSCLTPAIPTPLAVASLTTR